jgi:hypothetical protein
MNRIGRITNGITAFTAKSAKDAKKDYDLKAFAFLGVLGALGGRSRCRRLS